MFTSLSISNFRNLNELSLNSLARVNLITGKNNSGKSALLEAVALCVKNGELPFVAELLENRGENYSIPSAKNITEANTKSISSLFTRVTQSGNFSKEFSINAVESGVTNFTTYPDLVAENLTQETNQNHKLTFRIVTFTEESVAGNDQWGKTRKQKIIADIADAYEAKPGLQLCVNNNSVIHSFDEEHFFSRIYLSDIKTPTLQFIRPRYVDRNTNSTLWDSITLTPKEASVVEALRIIDPTIERLAFVNAGGTNRSAVVKLKNLEQPLPLRSMGDGINRILTIVLALVNAENGYLLIDEFENGLHHSVQLNLWKILIPLAAKLNVQIFATTHNDDCIAAFGAALTTTNAQQDGKLIRLASKNGTVQAVEFDSNALKIAIDNNIEIR